MFNGNLNLQLTVVNNHWKYWDYFCEYVVTNAAFFICFSLATVTPLSTEMYGKRDELILNIPTFTDVKVKQ